MPKQQTYANHLRWYPLFHFVVIPLLFVLFLFNLYLLYQAPSWTQAMGVLFVLAVALLALASRLQSLKVQDRVIRLEERLRHARVLPPELHARAEALTPSQLIALRFAADDELADLIERTLNGEFGKTKEIKLAVKNWRADWMRA